MTPEEPGFRPFVRVVYEHGQLRIETCTLADHLEALQVGERIERTTRVAIPEGLWAALALTVHQDKPLSPEVGGPHSYITLHTMFQILQDTEPQAVIRRLQNQTLSALRKVNFGFNAPVAEWLEDDSNRSFSSNHQKYIA